MTSRNALTREEIGQYFDRPASTNEESFQRIARFIRDTLGIDRFTREHLEWGRCSGWEFALDKDGKAVEEDHKSVPFQNRRSVRLVRLVVSRKGPFVACKTFTVVPRAAEERSDTDCDCAYELDPVVDPLATFWRKNLAPSSTGLHSPDSAAFGTGVRRLRVG
jgi:hypothetical protein